MIGVRKDSGVIRLLMAAALVLFVAACSGDSGVKQSVHDAALERVEELEGTVVDLTGSLDELREQLAALQESGTDADQEEIDALTARIAELEKEAMEAEAAKMRASVLALFKGLNPAINPESAGGATDTVLTDASLTRFDVDGSATAEENLSVSTTSGKATKVTPGTGTTNNKLAAAKGVLSDAQGPWSMTMVSAQDSGTKNTDTVVVLTDIAPDKQVAFEKVFTLNTANVLPQEDPTPAGAANDSIQSKYVSAPEFPVEVGVKTHGENEADETERIEYRGTYAGAPGIYVCQEATGTPCESQGTNDGVLLSNNWNFDPDGGAMAAQAATRYSHFGWWWRVSADGDYDVDVFHGNMGGRGVVAADFAALTDTATYVGPAVGKFAISPQLPGTTVMGGHWDATATLTVDFEEGDDPSVAEISGSIHDFMQDGDPLPFDVALPKTGVGAADGTTAAFANTTDVVWSIDGEKSNSKGTWSGNFWDQGTDEVPTTVTGEFAATYNSEVGRIEGAFGATKQ